MTEPLEVEKRLHVLKLAEEIGNVAEACRQLKMTRTQFYTYKRRFQIYGIDGLKDRPPIHNDHPFTTSLEATQSILRLSLEHHLDGCVKLSKLLKGEGCRVSSPTIQKILIKNGQGKRQDRLDKIRELASQPIDLLLPWQLCLLEKLFPSYLERFSESARPGETLVCGVIGVKQFPAIGKVWMFVFVDTYSSFAFAMLANKDYPDAAIQLLEHRIMPFYLSKGLGKVNEIHFSKTFHLTIEENGKFMTYINSSVHHLPLPVRVETNGFMDTFTGIIRSELLRKDYRSKVYQDFASLQTDLDRWITFYNFERSYRGYINFGKPPIDRINQYLAGHL